MSKNLCSCDTQFQNTSLISKHSMLLIVQKNAHDISDFICLKIIFKL